jgi:hypothetical protein
VDRLTSTPKTVNTFHSLPDSVIHLIFGFLPPMSLVNAILTCKIFARLGRQAHVWERCVAPFRGSALILPPWLSAIKFTSLTPQPYTRFFVPWFLPHSNVNLCNIIKLDLSEVLMTELPHEGEDSIDFINSFVPLKSMTDLCLPTRTFERDMYKPLHTFSLSALSNLTRLDAKSTDMSHAHAAHLTCLTRIIHLNLSHNRIDFDHMPCDILATTLSNLTYINFAKNCFPTHTCIIMLRACSSLDTMVLNHFDPPIIRDEYSVSVSQLRALTRLSHLYLTGFNFNIALFSQLSSLTQLKSLSLDRMDFVHDPEFDSDDEKFDYLQYLPRVTLLDVSDFCSYVKLPMLAQAIISHCPGLHTLHLRGPFIGYDHVNIPLTRAFQSLGGSPLAISLTSLDISDNKWMLHMGHIMRFTNLMSLNVDNNIMSLESWNSLVTHPNIRTLTASYCGILPEWCIELTHMTKLNKLSLLNKTRTPPIRPIHILPLMSTLVDLHCLDINLTITHTDHLDPNNSSAAVKLKQLLYNRN